MSNIVAYDRIVVFQPRSAWVCDLGAGSALSPRYSPGEEYFDTAAGTRKAIARTRSLVVPVFDEDKISHLRKMWKEGCEMRALLIGKKSHIVWELDSEFNMVDFGGDPGTVSGANLVFDSNLYVGSVYQSDDLLSFIPWECETTAAVGGTYYLPGPTGWQGNRYTANSGDSTDEDGALTTSGTVTLEMYFPLEGAGVQVKGAFIGSLKTLDYSGATLTTTTKSSNGSEPTATIDAGTWRIQINVTSASGRPKLYITSAGSLATDRVGACIDCSTLTATASTAPDWTS